MSARWMAFAAAMAGVVSACHVGARAERSRVAQGPVGARATCTMAVALAGGRGTTLKGELIAVRDSSLLVSFNGGFVAAQYTHITWCRFADLPELLADNMRLLDPRYREQLRLAARYPANLTSEQVLALLAANHQDSVRTW